MLVFNNCIFCNNLIDHITDVYEKIYDQYGEINCSCGNFRVLFEFDDPICVSFVIEDNYIDIQSDVEILLNHNIINEIIIDENSFNLDFITRFIKNKDLF